MIRPLIVSGGQTGVDRAALDVAISKGIPYSGWCPLGGRAEDFHDPPGLLTKYNLRQTPTVAAAQRTAWNVRDSNATLILLNGPTKNLKERYPGSFFTRLCAELIFLRPCHLVNLKESDKIVDSTARWLANLIECFPENQFTLNIAGPREKRESPGIYKQAFHFIDKLLG